VAVARAASSKSWALMMDERGGLAGGGVVVVVVVGSGLSHSSVIVEGSSLPMSLLVGRVSLMIDGAWAVE